MIIQAKKYKLLGNYVLHPNIMKSNLCIYNLVRDIQIQYDGNKSMIMSSGNHVLIFTSTTLLGEEYYFIIFIHDSYLYLSKTDKLLMKSPSHYFVECTELTYTTFEYLHLVLKQLKLFNLFFQGARNVSSIVSHLNSVKIFKKS